MESAAIAEEVTTAAEENNEGKYQRTVDLVPRQGQMIKASEVIDIRGKEALTLQDQRIYNQLLANAHGPQMAEPGVEHNIALSELRRAHKGNERISVTIRKLMTTIAETRDHSGKTRRFQLLGGNDMDDEDRPNGMLRYSFDRRLAEVMKDSISYGKLEISVMMAFRSKYSLALFEYGSKRARLAWKSSERLTLEEARAMLGVPEGKLPRFPALKQKALDPALLEVNHLADFEISMKPIKTSRSVTHVEFSWRRKTEEECSEAAAELDRPDVGRKARIEGTVEAVRPVEEVDLGKVGKRAA